MATETLSDDVMDDLEAYTEEALAGEIVDPEECLTLAFSRVDAIALAEFLAYVAVTYNHMPMIAEQVILSITDWERGE